MGYLKRSAFAVAFVVSLALPSHSVAATLMPDLGMARISDLKSERAADGRRLLRYTSIVVNTGQGKFEVLGQRSSTSDPHMSVVQRLYDDAGGYTVRSTPAYMFFAGDGHTHWHTADLETSALVRLDNGSKVGTGAKRGFCFYDNVRYRTSLLGAPQSPFYTGCGASADLAVQMGVSVGWGDAYYANLPDQYIDITGLGAGRYRLYVTADAQNFFAESNDFNNTTWVDLQFKGNGAPKIVGYGPAA
jgi:hypothetical protein